jgi:DNA end-binding protein Ku
MARALWTGSLSFGLVTVPVALYSAVRDRDIHFNLLHGPDNSPIETRRVCAHEQREVPYSEIVKGYELDDGRWVLLSDSDLEAAAPRKSHTIDIEAFVEEREIDPLYLDRPYLLVPENETAARAYALLSEAMASSGKVALGRFVMRAKENLVSIRPRGDLLALTTMRFHDEVRSSAEIAEQLASAQAPSEEEIENAMAIVAELEVPFEPEGYLDEHRAHLEAIIKRKRKGQKISVPKPKPAKKEEPAPVAPDLMGALEESLARIRGEAASTGKTPGGRTTAGNAGAAGKANTVGKAKTSAKPKRKPPAPKAPAKRASGSARRS